MCNCKTKHFKKNIVTFLRDFGLSPLLIGVLHMEVFTQRLEDEYAASVIVTPPSVPYKLKIKDDVAKSNRYSTTIESGNFITVNNPQDWPLVSDIEEYLEPIVHGNFELPKYDLILKYSRTTSMF